MGDAYEASSRREWTIDSKAETQRREPVGCHRVRGLDGVAVLGVGWRRRSRATEVVAKQQEAEPRRAVPGSSRRRARPRAQERENAGEREPRRMGGDGDLTREYRSRSRPFGPRGPSPTTRSRSSHPRLPHRRTGDEPIVEAVATTDRADERRGSPWNGVQRQRPGARGRNHIRLRDVEHRVRIPRRLDTRTRGKEPARRRGRGPRASASQCPSGVANGRSRQRRPAPRTVTPTIHSDHARTSCPATQQNPEQSTARCHPVLAPFTDQAREHEKRAGREKHRQRARGGTSLPSSPPSGRRRRNRPQRTTAPVDPARGRAP